MENLIVVLEGPSGVGKDSIIQGLIAKHPDIYAKLPSVTTRSIRPGESQYNPYLFVKEKEFMEMVARGDIFEHDLRYETRRGMSRRLIDNILDEGKIPVKDLTPIGYNALKHEYPNQVLMIFIKAPRADVEKRLAARGDSAEERKMRLKEFDKTMTWEVDFDYSIENKDLEKSVEEIHRIIQKRRNKHD